MPKWVVNHLQGKANRYSGAAIDLGPNQPFESEYSALGFILCMIMRFLDAAQMPYNVLASNSYDCDVTSTYVVSNCVSAHVYVKKDRRHYTVACFPGFSDADYHDESMDPREGTFNDVTNNLRQFVANTFQPDDDGESMYRTIATNAFSEALKSFLEFKEETAVKRPDLFLNPPPLPRVDTALVSAKGCGKGATGSSKPNGSRGPGSSSSAKKRKLNARSLEIWRQIMEESAKDEEEEEENAQRLAGTKRNQRDIEAFSDNEPWNSDMFERLSAVAKRTLELSQEILAKFEARGYKSRR